MGILNNLSFKLAGVSLVTAPLYNLFGSIESSYIALVSGVILAFGGWCYKQL